MITAPFNHDRALELLAQMRSATLDTIVARNEFKAARSRRRDALVALRDARRKLNDFLAGRDSDAQIPLALNGNGHSSGHADPFSLAAGAPNGVNDEHR